MSNLKNNTIEDLTLEVVKFRDEREWKQFHNPKDLALSLLLEASELIEFMQWKSGRELENYLLEKRKEVGEELADIFYWTLLIAHDLDIDLTVAFREKMIINIEKYPVKLARGNSKKYIQLRTQKDR